MANAGSQLSKRSDVKRPLILTFCSSRKRVVARIRAVDLPRAPQRKVEREWLKMLEITNELFEARGLYTGRGFRIAAKAADIIGADLGIVSAGLGYVCGNTPIPSYDITLAGGALRNRIRGSVDIASWWKALRSSPFAIDMAADLRGRPFVLACLSRSYASLVQRELLTISPERLRIFGMGLGAILPRRLAKSWLPYDNRLNKSRPFGTSFDFAQRALWHYVTVIRKPEKLGLITTRKAVLNYLARLGPRITSQQRIRVDDDTIVLTVTRLLRTIGKGRTLLLRHLRQAEGLACESSRFARLYSKALNAL